MEFGFQDIIFASNKLRLKLKLIYENYEHYLQIMYDNDNVC